MRVSIKRPVSWVGPYQIAEMLCFWAKNSDEEYINGGRKFPEWVHNFGGWLAGGDDKESLLCKACQSIHSIRVKLNKPKIKIHNYDTWSMDTTLSPIILPMLKQLKETNHGAGFVDDEDVPEHLRSTAAEPKENEWDTDSNHFDRWNWVMDEMIWAFEQICDDEAESQFHTGHIDFVSTPVDKDGNEVPKEGAKLFRMDRGPDDTSHYDHEGHVAWGKRVQHGTKLFGKYFQSLWS